MKIAPVADVKARLSRYLELCAEQPIVVTKNGRPTAVLVGVVDEEDLERFVLAHTPRFRAILDAADRRIEQGRGIPHRTFWKAVTGKRRQVPARLKRPTRVPKGSKAGSSHPR